MLSDAFVHTLKIIEERLRPSRIEWYVTGKGNLALQGMDINPMELHQTKRAIDLYLTTTGK